MGQLRHKPSSVSLDDFFLSHYADLIARARQLVGRDQQAAEDLVHDAYLRLAMRQFDLSGVRNVEAYLVMTLRNAHLSQVRRRGAAVAATMSILDYESMASALRSLTADAERQRACDTLRDVVRYACLRKSSSKAASVLILRFFHGYYPGEIVRVTRTSEAAVTGRLRMARAEARAYVEDPGRVRFFDERHARRPLNALGDTASVLALRLAIFEARTGTCLSARALEHLYARQTSDPLDVSTLAHLVSCAACLDMVNRRLGLPLLSDRDPDESLGRGPASGGAGGTHAGRGGAGPADPASLLRTRLEDVQADHPQELQIAVNGLFVSAHAVNGPVSEQRLKILVLEPVGFVEIFNEHGTCLLYLDVEPPPHGLVEQAARVALSDGRRLFAEMTFAEAAPTLRVVYEDVACESPSAFERQPVAERTAPSTAPSVEHMPASSFLRFWRPRPATLRLVLAGIVLGLLLANPRQTLAAVSHVRRLIVDSITRVLDLVHPRAELPSRSIPHVANGVPLATAIESAAPRLSAPVVTTPTDASDVELSQVGVEALRVLDAAGALTAEQVSLRRGADRRIHIEGVVETAARRRALVAALQAVPDQRLQVDLLAIDETPRELAPDPDPSPLRSTELTRGDVPAAYALARERVSARAAATGAADTMTDASINAAVRRLSTDILASALRARLQGRIVRALVAAVPPADARRLSAQTRATWEALVRRHAESFCHETRGLRRELEQVFPPAPPDAAPSAASAATTIGSRQMTDPWQMADRLFELASAHDAAVRRAFAVVAQDEQSLDVGTPAFYQSLLDAEQIAEALLAAPTPTQTQTQKSR